MDVSGGNILRKYTFQFMFTTVFWLNLRILHQVYEHTDYCHQLAAETLAYKEFNWL